MAPDDPPPPGLPEISQRALDSLRAHPELNTPELIAGGPFGLPQLDAEKFEEGLKYLKLRLRADATDGKWAAND